MPIAYWIVRSQRRRDAYPVTSVFTSPDPARARQTAEEHAANLRADPAVIHVEIEER